MNRATLREVSDADLLVEARRRGVIPQPTETAPGKALHELTDRELRETVFGIGAADDPEPPTMPDQPLHELSHTELRTAALGGVATPAPAAPVADEPARPDGVRDLPLHRLTTEEFADVSAAHLGQLLAGHDARRANPGQSPFSRPRS